MRNHTTRIKQFTAATLVFTHLFVFHTEEVAWASGAAGGASAMAASQALINAAAPEAFQVDLFTGRAATGFPIAVPPGRKSMQPSLGLSYASAQRNGWLGIGWDLDLGLIQRETKAGVPHYDNTDTFLLRFQGINSPLVEISAGQYRLENEGAFLKIEKSGSGWTVRDRTGTVFSFGATAGAQVQGGGGVFSWHLDRVEDLNGNYMTVSYQQDGNAIYPFECHYTGHTATGLSPTNTVRFTLEDRPDAVPSMISGTEIVTAKRLAGIAVLVGTETVRRYQLSYHESAETGRSLLEAITQVGRLGGTLPPVTFSYQEDSAVSFDIEQNTAAAGNNRWMIRTGAGDFFHSNESLLLPSGQYVGIYGSGAGNGAIVRFGEATDDLAGVGGGVQWTQDGNGAFSITGAQDTHFHAFTFFHTEAAADITFPSFGGHDKATGVFVNGNEQVWFGDASTQTIHLNKGFNLIEFTGYNQNNGWAVDFDFNAADYPEIDFMNSFQFIQPQFVGDFNGDGVSDLAAYDVTKGEATVSVGRTFNFIPEDPWITGFGNASTTPFLGDFNRDGKTDWGVFDNGTWRIAPSNGVNGFSAPAAWRTGFGVAGDRPFTGDFNGDGFIDAGIFNAATGDWDVALSDGAQFLTPGTWISGFGAGATPFTGDFNGDGLMDILSFDESAGDWRVALSNGSGFTGRGVWLTGFGVGMKPIVIDCNGDGLTDVGYYDTATGEVFVKLSNGYDAFSKPCHLGFTFSLTGPDFEFQPGDFTGDGIMDPAIFNSRSNGEGEVGLSSGKTPDLLSAIDNGRGGRTEITYRSSASYINAGGDEIHDMPFVLPLIDTVTQRDGLGGAYTTFYSFRGGKYDFQDHEFRGFRAVDITDAERNIARHIFAQDDMLKGRLLETSVVDSSNRLWTRTTTEWGASAPYPGTSARFVFSSASETAAYDGNSTAKRARTEYTYDGFGNVTEVRELGDVALAGDERVTRTSYAINTGAWLISQVDTSTVEEADGTVLSSRSFDYDAAGNLRYERVWLSDPREAEDRELTTEFRYDEYGNIKEVENARGEVSKTFYDTGTETYPVRTENALGHAEEFTYDPAFGELISRRDANDVEARLELDEFGRKVRIFNPGDAADDPAVTISYDDTYIDADGDGVGEVVPSVTQEAADGSAGDGVFHLKRFLDGLGRTVQVRSESEDAGVEVVSGGVTFNERGFPEKQYVPYFETASDDYVPLGAGTPLAELRAIAFSFDPLGRRTQVDFPDGTSVSTAYDDWTERFIDARGNPTERRYDGLGRIRAVTEFLDGDDLTTTYAYDAGDRLLGVTNPLGTSTAITYDTAGRKIYLDDPDSGLTEYRYDDMGNLIAETDALGVVTEFTYDALDRPLTKSFPNAAPGMTELGQVTYTYDGVEDPENAAARHAAGRLTLMTDEATSTFFDYDEEGRLGRAGRYVVELGAELLVSRTYDRLGRDLTVTYPDGQAVAYTYNASGGIETVALASGGGSGESLIHNFDYNAAGQLTRMDYTNGVSTGYFYSPDTLRLERLITQANLLPNDLVNPLSYSPSPQTRQALHYQFDPNGNITTLVDQLHTATQNFTYDDLNRLTRAVSASYGGKDYVYDAAGNLLNKAGVGMTYGASGAGPHAVTAAELMDGSVMAFQYDAAGNMTRRGDADMYYDEDHRLRKVTQADNDLRTVAYHLEAGWNFVSFPVLPADHLGFNGEGVPVSGAVNKKKISGVLDAAGVTFGEEITQISKWNAALGTWEHFVGDPDFSEFDTFEIGVGYQVYAEAPADFSLTGLANQTDVNHLLGEGENLVGFAIDEDVPASEIGLHYSFTGAIEDILRYDTASGSLKSLNAGEITTFSPGEAYVVKIADEAGEGVFSLPSDTRTAEYTYDATGSRVSKKAGSGLSVVDPDIEQYFLGEGYEIDVVKGVEKKSIFVGDLRLFTVELDIQSGAFDIHNHHPDHLGSLNTVTDDSGQSTFLAEYTPFGEVARVEGEPPSAFGFTDQEHDPSGLVYMNARYYDPLCARFTQPDDMVQDPFDPQFLNRYTYVRNNPIQFTDPSGLFSIEDGTLASAQIDKAILSIPPTGIPPIDALVGITKVAIKIIQFVSQVIKVIRFFDSLFSSDSDNGFHGVNSIAIIRSQFLQRFNAMSDGVRAVGSTAAQVSQGIIEPLATTLNSPGTNYGRYLAEIDSGKITLKGFYGASLDSAWFMLGVLGAYNAVAANAAPYGRYVGPQSYPNSRWVWKGHNPPYGNDYSKAMSRLSSKIEWNSTRSVDVPFSKYVAGPRPVAPQFGKPGFGSEYRIGGFNDWGKYVSLWFKQAAKSIKK